MVPLLLLTLALVLSFSVNDAAAAGTSNSAIVPSQNLQLTSTSHVANTQTTDQSKIKTNTSKTNTTSKIADPQIYNSGAPVARGGHPAGYIFPTIASAITNAQSGDTIMLENGATFLEHGLIINKNLNFNVFSNGHATIDGQNLGTVFIISKGVTSHFQNLIITRGRGVSGGGIQNNGILTLNNCVFTNNHAQNGGAIYNGGTVSYISTTRTSETVSLNGGTLTVNNCIFTGNTASQNGGAIYNAGTINVDASTLTSVTITKNGGTATISNSTFKSNSAQNGGAIFNGGTLDITTSSTLTDCTVTNNGGTLTINKSVFSGNTAANNGGAIANDATFNVVDSSTLTRAIITKNGGTVTVTSSFLLGNNAINGGAISNVADVNTRNAATLTGPATSLNTGTVTVTDSTIMGNNASNNGGAIYNAALTTTTDTTFTNYLINNVATISATFNTFSGNSALRGGAIYNNAISTVTTNSLTSTTLQNTATATSTDNALVNDIALVGREIVNNVVTTENTNAFVTSPIPANTGTVNAIRNWWGTTSGPLANDVVGTVAVNPFLIYSINSVITASNSSPNVGQQFHYTITVTNNGPDTATDVQVTDGIPAGLTFNGFVASQGTYNHATEIWNVRSLASGASATLELFVTPTASVAGTIITKVVTLVNTNTTDTTTVTVPGTPLSVILIKTAGNTAPNVGQQFRYDLIVANTGSTTATGVLVTDVIPAGLIFNSYTTSKGTYNSANGIWSVGNLASGASAILHLFVTPTASVAGTTVINTATVAGQTATAIIAVPSTPLPVVLTKTASNFAPNIGQQFHYTLSVINNGPNTATNVNVTDVIPVGLVFNSFTASQGFYNHITGIWSVGTLANGADATLELFVTPTASVAGTFITNAASIPGQIANAPIFVTTTVENNGTNTGNNTNNANAETVPMQKTGVPITGLILGTIMVLSAAIIPRIRK
jgi:uncharacterized repeat protein (TIGR01451 family)